jgi:hypothetical protein
MLGQIKTERNQLYFNCITIWKEKKWMQVTFEYSASSMYPFLEVKKWNCTWILNSANSTNTY